MIPFFHTHKQEKNRQFVPIFLQNCCSDYIGSHITVIKKYKRDTTKNLIDEPNMAAIPNQSHLWIRLLFDLKVQL